MLKKAIYYLLIYPKVSKLENEFKNWVIKDFKIPIYY